MREISGDIFEVDADVLVNPVNTAGVMGKGLAAAFKQRYPAMFEAYKAACDSGALYVGTLQLWTDAHPWILNFPTKKHWRSKSTLEIIQTGLQVFVTDYAGTIISRSVVFPKLGSGLGGLDYDTQVRPLMQHYLNSLSIDIFVVI